MNETVEIRIKDNRNNQEATITLEGAISDAILFYVMKFVNYQGENPMEAAVQFFVQQGTEVATSMIRSQKAAEAEAAVTQFMQIVEQAQSTPEETPE